MVLIRRFESVPENSCVWNIFMLFTIDKPIITEFALYLWVNITNKLRHSILNKPVPVLSWVNTRRRFPNNRELQSIPRKVYANKSTAGRSGDGVTTLFPCHPRSLSYQSSGNHPRVLNAFKHLIDSEYCNSVSLSLFQ